MGSARSTLPHIGSARTVDNADAFGDTRNTLPHTSSARTEEQPMFRDTRTRELSHDKDARFRLDEQPTHENDRRNSGDLQQSSYHPGHTLSFARQSSSPKSRHSMGQIQPSSGRGLYNLRPSRAIRAGQQGNGSSAWSPR